MDVPVLEMNKEQAAEKAAEYKEMLAKSYPETATGRRQHLLDLAAETGFRALAAGKRVINLQSAFSHAGLFTEGRFAGLPKLAIARADAVKVNYDWHLAAPRFSSEFCSWGQHRGGLIAFKFVWQVMHNPAINYTFIRRPFERRNSYSAIVPSIPPAARPRYARLHKYAILWEANWEFAPADPFLLRPLAGDLFTVEAEWDLTNLERGLLEHARLS